MNSTLKALALTLLFFGFFENSALCQDYRSASETFKTKKSKLTYHFGFQSDSLFVFGQLIEKKSKAPMINTNIVMVGENRGTVPQLDGTFRLFIRKREGQLLFHKVEYDQFIVDYIVPADFTKPYPSTLRPDDEG